MRELVLEEEQAKKDTQAPSRVPSSVLSVRRGAENMATPSPPEVEAVVQAL